MSNSSCFNYGINIRKFFLFKKKKIFMDDFISKITYDFNGII